DVRGGRRHEVLALALQQDRLLVAGEARHGADRRERRDGREARVEEPHVDARLVALFQDAPEERIDTEGEAAALELRSVPADVDPLAQSSAASEVREQVPGAAGEARRRRLAAAD